MPLGRFSVRNEYGLGGKELYKEGVESEDPKAVLDGVAVAGLVGLLRQLGDLSQFAAEIFHGLQEQVAYTVSRSRKLGTRVQRVEASLPSLEKAILSQTSHIHFAYSPGSEWHPHIKNGQNHFICDDLPHFIMDSYEECHEPPRLQLLDRFDTGGPGACLKRYSDPTFFRRASTSSELRNKDKSLRERKARKIKRKRSSQRSGHIPNCVPTINNNERVQTSSQTGRGEPSLSQTGSTFDRTSISDLGDQSDSLGSKISTQPNKTKNKDLSSTVDGNMASETNYSSKHFAVASKGVQGGFATDTIGPPCSDVTWDEKLEIMEHMGLNYGIENVQNSPETKYYLQQNDLKPVSMESIDQIGNLFENGSITKSEADQQFTNGKLRESTGPKYIPELEYKTVDAKNSQVDDLSEVSTMERKFIESNIVESFDKLEGLAEHGSSSESIADEKYPTTVFDWEMEVSDKDSGTDEVQDLNESSYDFHEHDSVKINPDSNFYEGEDTNHANDLVLANLECFPQVAKVPEGENFPKLIADGQIVSDSFDSKLRIGDVQYMLETIENDNWAIETIKGEHVAEFSKGENSRESIDNDNFMSELADNKLKEYDAPVNTDTKEVNNANLIEWALHDDIDSETDNFVDALNTIDSESESEYESQTRKQVEPSASKYELPKDASYDLVVDTTNQSRMENDSLSRRHESKDDVYDGLGGANSPFSLPNLEYLENSVPYYQSEAATSQEQQCPPVLPIISQDVESSTFKNILPVNVSTTDPMVDNISQSEPEQESHSRRHDSEVYDALEGATSSLSNHQLEAEKIQEQEVLSAPCLSTVSQDRQACINSDEIRLEPHASGEMPLRSTSSLPHAFWTNATLFGLQPSKPTVNGISNSPPMGSGKGNIVNHLSSKVDDSGRTMSSSVKIYVHDERNKCDDSAISAHDNGYVTVPHSEVPSNVDLKNVCSESTTNTSEERSSLLSLLGRNLMKKGVRRISGSLDYYEKEKHNYPLPDPVPESNINGKLQSLVNSPPPSPPLELMKISFQPIDGFETSKLKLKYPKGTDNDEMTVETFPSFQLVPESTSMQHDLGSDSDDDTFCRSYPCISDDNMTHVSDSGSEQWETGDSLESNDHSFYDGLRRIPSIESASSSSQHDEIDQRGIDARSRSFKDVHSISGPTSQLPILGTKNNFDFQDFTAQLPPLPPLQWCVSKPVGDGQEYEGLHQSFNTQLSDSTISRPGVDDSAKLQNRTKESDKIVKYEKQGGEAKVHDQKQIVPTADGKTVDDRDDFLHQIRTKSFNLKRTEAARSLSTPSLSPSNKLTAILQKASAIRQAVASDDDSWSDT